MEKGVPVESTSEAVTEGDAEKKAQPTVSPSTTTFSTARMSPSAPGANVIRRVKLVRAAADAEAGGRTWRPNSPGSPEMRLYDHPRQAAPTTARSIQGRFLMM